MPPIREPVIHPVPIAELRPTQITIGRREVDERRKHWRAEKSRKHSAAFLGTHMIPVVVGPKKRHYIIDHHHLALALMEEGLADIFVLPVAQLDRLKQDMFWMFLDNRGWMHPFDDKGRRRPYDEIPHSLRDMVDDPFRSLAGALRRAGGYAKDTTPFSEFLWADFLRRRIRRRQVKDAFAGALREAVKLAKSRDADYLPGWCGTVDEA
ncbi:MAG TPA: ParB-like protein [Rhizomicrobium sp.]|nr:ParB-like protein [Rhizomicrobium sp.]